MRSLTFVLFVFAFPAAAQDLRQVFRDAKAYDAQYAAARFALQAGLEKLPQGRALILPTLNLTAGATHTDQEFRPQNSAAASLDRDFRSQNYALSFSQPVFRRQNTLQYNQSEYQVKQAEAVFGQAGQDLIVRAAQAYFDLLAADDSLTLVRAQKTAIAEQLAQAKRNFEVGTATITDTHEAQSRFDLTAAQEIVAQNEVDTKRRVLQQLAGKEYVALRPLRSQIKLTPPNPPIMQNWVDIAEKQGYPVQIQESAVEIAQLEAKRQSAGHYPTLDLVATRSYNDQNSPSITGIGGRQTTSTIGLQFALPLYAGGAINSREREAAANYEKSKQDLENARRSSALATRQSYLLVINGIAVVGALEQALISSQSALDSNKLGYEVGVRINIDVLNAQQQVFLTRRDLLVARYGTIMNHFRLKAAAGTLREEELEEVNRALEP